MGPKVKDDVIRIRVDASRCVRTFLDLLSHQAREGETRAPAKPRTTALFRELAPFRLVEYNYVDQSVGAVQGAYVALPGGTVYAASDEIPETAVDEVLEGSLGTLPPVYVFVVLEDAATPAEIDHYLTRLSQHLGLGFVGVYHDRDGEMTAVAYGGDDDALIQSARLALTETSLHLSREEVLDRHVARSQSPDGRAFARVTYGFVKHVLEFHTAAARDDFVAWSRRLCEWVSEGGTSWDELGFVEMFRPAEPAPEPEQHLVVTALSAPAAFNDGQPWQAFDTGSDASARLEAAARYWHFVKDSIDGEEAGFSHLDGWVVRN